MFCHNSTIHSTTKYQPYQLVYGNSVVVPSTFTQNPDPQYNYENYHHTPKKNMQEAHALPRKHLLEAKQKSKDYDKLVKSLKISIGEKFMIQEKASKDKVAPKWLDTYIVIKTHPESPNIKILKLNKPVTLYRNLLKRFHEIN
jgi:hypothetical protein|uniref:Retrovirus-related Pol polyprotein n=1 Tax=Sipha flava TaxID=143950 RepID=A0A2S2QTR9_9HEMI